MWYKHANTDGHASPINMSVDSYAIANARSHDIATI